MQINVITPHSEEEWDKYLLASKYAEFLQSFCWAQLLKVAYGFKPVFLEVQDTGTPVAYLVFHEGFAYRRSKKIAYRLLSPLRRYFTRDIVASGGPVILDDSQTEEILSSVSAWLNKYSRENRIRSISLTPFKYNEACADNPSIKKIFEDSGYAARKWATYFIDLKQDEEILWNNMKHSTRNKVIQTNNMNLIVKRTEIYGEFIEKFAKPYNRMEKEMGREEIPLWFTEKLKDFDLKDRYYHYFYAEIDGNIVGVLGMYVYNGYATEITSSTSKYAYENKVHAQDLLKWEMLKFAKNLGCHTWDLNGVNPDPQTGKERGIKQFKSKWGGEYRGYFIYDLHFKGNIIFNAMKKVYQISEVLLNRLQL